MFLNNLKEPQGRLGRVASPRFPCLNSFNAYIEDFRKVRDLMRLTALIAFILFAITATVSQGAQFEVGKPFPDISLPSLKDGSPVSIHQFHGKKTILHIFASW